MLSSWMIIFIHGVVPHLHADHSDYDLHPAEESHHIGCTQDHSDEDSTLDLNTISQCTHDHNSTVCHFNPNLFSQLDYDFAFVYDIKVEADVPDASFVVESPDTQPKYKKPPLLAETALRAPPQV